MRILFTGASSFSGFWFVQTLSKMGHDVTAIFQRERENYHDLRKERVDLLSKCARLVFATSFGEESFFDLLQTTPPFDLLCHHAAEVTDYKSVDFNVTQAVANNTKEVKKVLHTVQSKGCNKLLLTGSVFEPGEGSGSEGLRAVSPYGLSKGLTSDIFKYYASTLGIHLGKFVIPNPFGPYEELRFTSYLIQQWSSGKVACVSSPSYVRDNIHISLLAKAYATAVTRIDLPFQQWNPSGYVESQGSFTLRFANEMRKRLSLSCEFDLQKQTGFFEPRVRINSDILDHDSLQWKEEAAWDELAEFYRRYLYRS